MTKPIRLIRCHVSYNLRNLESGTDVNKTILAMIPDSVTVFTPCLRDAAMNQVRRHEAGGLVDITNIKLAQFAGVEVRA
jgi:hypothetical protein